jgi:prepilin-type N-terminal cleavage/methylation domain-containing protein
LADLVLKIENSIPLSYPLSYSKHVKRSTNGFTIFELMIVVVIIGIITTITIISYSTVQANSRDAQRSSKITSIAEALEKYYSKNGEYPSCADMTKSAAVVASSTLDGLSPSTLATPSASQNANSVICNAIANGSSIDAFAYVGDSSASCTSGHDCLQYTLQYRKESNGSIVSIVSRHQVNVATSGTITNLTATVTSSSQINLSWTAINDAVNYTVQQSTNSSFTSNLVTTPTASSFLSVTGLANGTTYYFRVAANFSVGSSAWSNTANATTYFVLTLVAGTGGTVNAGGSYTYGATPTITASPSTGHLFSSWTGSTGCSGVASHTVTMTANMTCTANFVVSYTLTLAAGTGGTVSGGGTYASGSTPTITASPNASYLFSSWTGSTGCSGVASHTVTMTANMTCTANFVIITYTLALGYSGTGNWNWCASENGTCSFSGSRTVLFGSGFGWTSIGGVNGSIACNNATFGDPSPGYAKSCYYPDTLSVSGAGTYNSGSYPTVTASPSGNVRYWYGDSGCSSIPSSNNIAMNGNKNCTAYFTPTANTPATPIVSQSTSGSTTTFSWGAICPGNSAQYEWEYTNGSSSNYSSNYNSGWSSPTTATSINIGTGTEGYGYAVYIQAQCYNSYSTSGWSGVGSNSFYRSVAGPSGISFGISRVSSTTVQVSATSSCDSGMTLYWEDDIGTWTSPYYWHDNGQYGWWAGTHGASWLNGWGNYGNPFYQQSSNSSAIASGAQYTMAVNIKCTNYSTGDSSGETGRIESGRMGIP